jgi:hypothetical protein
MKSLITENEKQRIRLMHINQKHKLLKEQVQFDDLYEIDPSTIKTADGTPKVDGTVSTCAVAPELKTLADEGKFRTWVKTTYPNNAVSGIKLSDPRWKNPPTKFCNTALGNLWKAKGPTSTETYGQLYLKTIK